MRKRSSKKEAKDVIEEYTNRVREEIKKKEDKVGDNEYNYVEKRVVGCDERERWSDYRTEAINKTDIKNIIKLSTIGCEYAELEDVKSSRAILLTISMKNEKSKDKLGYIVGGEIVELEIKAKAQESIRNIICGFLLKNERGQTLLGDNTLNDMRSGLNRDTVSGNVIKTSFCSLCHYFPKVSITLISVLHVGRKNHTKS